MSLDHTWISKAPMKCLPTLELWVKCLQCLDYFLSRVYVALHPIVQSLPSNLWLVDLAMRLTLSKKSSQIGIELTDVIWAKASKGPVILYFYHSYENGLSGATGPQEWGTWDRVTWASAVLGVQEPEESVITLCPLPPSVGMFCYWLILTDTMIFFSWAFINCMHVLLITPIRKD